MNTASRDSDFLVIGSGIAGLSFAIQAAHHGTVSLVTKKLESDSNTNYAQGGIAAVLSPDDSFEDHVHDTLEAGGGLNNPEAVRILVENGPASIRELAEWGTEFTRQKMETGEEIFDLGMEGGHSHKRILHARDLTGKEIERALIATAAENPNIYIFENHTAVDLLTEHQLRLNDLSVPHGDNRIHCYGAYILDNNTGAVETFRARITLLATGGLGQVYLHTTNPSIATGDGIAMAYRAGALIADMEFIQFHPTSLYSTKQEERSFLISEAVRGEGAILADTRGRRFMENDHPRKELAPRDVVARAIDRELKRTGDRFVYLDISHRDRNFLQKRFPSIYDYCLKEGIDISQDPIPVVPAAHYLCGGIVTDTHGKTTIENLYASGESARTGVHGANRLASNSLLEGVVFSNRSVEHAIEALEKKREEVIPEYPVWNKEGTFDLEEWVLIQHSVEEIKRLMWDYVGIVRTNLRLERAHRWILMLAEEVHDHYRKSTVSSRIVELRNLATVAKLIIKGAMTRRNSVGLHFNLNFPERGEGAEYVILQSEEKPRLVPRL